MKEVAGEPSGGWQDHRARTSGLSYRDQRFSSTRQQAALLRLSGVSALCVLCNLCVLHFRKVRSERSDPKGQLRKIRSKFPPKIFSLTSVLAPKCGMMIGSCG